MGGEESELHVTMEKKEDSLHISNAARSVEQEGEEEEVSVKKEDEYISSTAA